MQKTAHFLTLLKYFERQCMAEAWK